MTSVLLVAAHPDDTEFITGGTVASLIASGASVHYVIVTSGELGVPSSVSQRHETDSPVREAEQLAAAAVLGVAHTVFLRHPDGAVDPGAQLREEVVRAIRSFRPSLVITHSPDRNYQSIRFSHRDHLAVGRAVLDAIYPDARSEWMYPNLVDEGLQPHVVEEVWLHGSERADYPVDITDVFDKKLSAIRCHGSQLTAFNDVTEFFQEWGGEVADAHGLAGRLAEQYQRLETR